MEGGGYTKIDYAMEREGLEKVCKYALATGSKVEGNPHNHEVRDFSKKIKNDITEMIGNTPMVRINSITKKEGIKCELCKHSILTFDSGQVRVS